MQRFHEQGERKRVHDVLFCEPTFAGDHRAEAEEHGVFVAVGVAVDDAFHTFVARVFPEAPIQIEAVGAGVEFDPGAGFGASIDDRVLIHFAGFAFEEEAAGDMTEDLHERIFHRADEAFGHVLFGLGEGLMNAGDDDVEFGEQIVGKIESAIGENIDLRAGEEAEIDSFGGEALVERFYFNDLLADAIGLKAVGDDGRF